MHLFESLELRRLLSGGIDPTFNGGGNATASSLLKIDFKGGSEGLGSLASYPDGKILIAGTWDSGPPDENSIFNPHAMLVRLNADGSLDQSFADHGKLIGTPRGVVLINRLAIMSDGSFLALGGPRSGNGDTVLHFSSTGKLDTTFGRNGALRFGAMNDLALLPDGKFLVAGAEGAGATVMRFNASGTLDRTFATNGAYRADSDRVTRYQYIDVDAAGDIYLLGDRIDFDDNGNVLFATLAARLDTTGNVKETAHRIADGGAAQYIVSGKGHRYFLAGDNLFDLDTQRGVHVLSQFPEVELNGAAFKQRDGKLMLPVNGNNNFNGGLLRLNADLTRDTTFGINGVLQLGGDTPVAIEGADGSTIFAAGFGTKADIHDVDGEYIQIGRVFRDDKPTALASARNVRGATSSSQVINITYRDDHGINLSTLDNRDIRVAGPNGFVGAAKFIGLTSELNGLVVRATYKLVAPGRIWDATDNGAYSMRLYDAAVSDVDGNGISVRDLGTFLVRIS